MQDRGLNGSKMPQESKAQKRCQSLGEGREKQDGLVVIPRTQFITLIKLEDRLVETIR